MKGGSVGQPVRVTVKDTLDSNVKRFETDRWLTGMGGRLYFAPAFRPTGAPVPRAGSLEERILAIPGVASVYVYGSTITVSKDQEATWEDLQPKISAEIENAFRFYKEAS
jgi:hypothetical protein